MSTLYLNGSADSQAIQLLLLFTQNQVEIAHTKDTPFVKSADGEFSGALTVIRYLLSTFSSQWKSLLRESSNESFYILQNTHLIRKELAAALASKNDAATKEILTHFTNLLKQSTYVVGNSISIADFFLYAHLQPVIAALASNPSYIALLRWFNLMQFHAPWSNGIKGGVDSPNCKLSYVHIDIAKLQPAFEFKAIVPAAAPAAKDDKKADAKQPAADAKKGDDKKAADAKQQPAKKDDKKQQAAPAAKKTVDVAAVPTAFDIRVGKVVHVEKHPNADRMYVEHIDFGEEKPRIVCSGLVGKVEMSELKDRVLIAVCNLKPANLKGIDSQAMVLVASNGDKYEIPTVPQGAKIGERVFYDGHSGEPGKDFVKEHMEVLLPGLKTNDNGELTNFGAVAKVSTGAITSSFKNVPVK